MSNEKKYIDYVPYMVVMCIKPIGMLHPGWRKVIGEDDSKYLIQFNSGAAHWYSKKRFAATKYLQ